MPSPLAQSLDYETRWHIANSPAGEALLDFPAADLNSCGTSYESGGYRWGAS